MNGFVEINDNGLIVGRYPSATHEAKPEGDQFIDVDEKIWTATLDNTAGKWVYQIADKSFKQIPYEVTGITGKDVDAERDRRLDSGFTFNGVFYQSAAADRENIAGAVQLAFMAIVVNGAAAGDLRWSQPPDEDFVWVAADNSRVPMDAPTVQQFGTALAKWKQSLVYAGRALKDKDKIPDDYVDDKYWPVGEV